MIPAGMGRVLANSCERGFVTATHLEPAGLLFIPDDAKIRPLVTLQPSAPATCTKGEGGTDERIQRDRAPKGRQPTSPGPSAAPPWVAMAAPGPRPERAKP